VTVAIKGGVAAERAAGVAGAAAGVWTRSALVLDFASGASRSFRDNKAARLLGGEGSGMRAPRNGVKNRWSEKKQPPCHQGGCFETRT